MHVASNRTKRTIMSRIGQRGVTIPSGVDVKVEKGIVTVKGAKGEQTLPLHHSVDVEITDGHLMVVKKNESKVAQAMWGTMTRLIANMIEGVTNGFTKKLELTGVGFRIALKGKQLDMALGFSHPVIVDIPDDLTVTVEGLNITVAGPNKQRVGQFAAEIRSLKPVEPYKGKGFKYEGEHVRRKEGKKAA